VLTVALLQLASATDPAANRDALDRVVAAVAGRPDTPAAGLVVRPEAFQRDFGASGSDVSRDAEPLDGPFVRRLCEVAAAAGTTVVAGMFEVSEDPARPYNTLVVVDTGGLRASYRKIHLYDSFGYKESDRLTAGPLEPVLMEIGGFRLGLMTCYDLRFPELARQLVDRGAEALVVPSAWVAGPAKVDHWRTLVKARAIENTVFVVAVGQPAPRYCGHSMVVDPDGEVLVELGDDEGTGAATLDRDRWERVRATNPSLANRRL
jgi:predicted amidohydrolase